MLKKLKKVAAIVLVTSIVGLLTLTACSTSASGTPPTTAAGTKTTVTTASSSKSKTTSTTAKETDKRITIKDPELEKVIRKALTKPDGDITTADMKNLKSIRVDAKVNPVKDLDGLEHAVNLNSFSYSYGTVTSLEPIAKLKTVTYITFSYAKSDQAPTTFDMPELDRASFIETNISNFTFLKNAPLRDVTFSRCGITSIEFLRDKKNLQNVNLPDNNITDISPLKDKTLVKYVNLHKNQVSDISFLSTCTALESMNISYNHVSNLTPIMLLPALKELTAYEDLDKKIIDRGQITALIAKGVTVEYHK